MDAAHFVHRAYLGVLWCFTRIFIASPSGRQRFNVLGAVNAITKEVLTVTNESYINAQSICLMLLKLHALDLDINGLSSSRFAHFGHQPAAVPIPPTGNLQRSRGDHFGSFRRCYIYAVVWLNRAIYRVQTL